MATTPPKILTFTLAATGDAAGGDKKQIPGKIIYFMLRSAGNTSAVQGRFGSRVEGFNSEATSLPRGFKSGPMSGIDLVEIINTDGAPNAITIAYGDSDFSFNEATADVNIAIPDGSDVTLGAKGDAAATSDTAAATLIALTKRLLVKSSGQFLGQSASLADLATHDVADPGAGKVCVVDALLVCNPDAGVAADVTIAEETTGTIFVVHAPAKSSATHRLPFRTAATAKKLQASASAAAAITVAAFGRTE